MALFSFNKKKPVEQNPNAYIKVLGPGCKNCMDLEENVKKAVKELGRTDTVGHISDMQTIISYGVISTPALVIGNDVVSSGVVLSPKAVMDILREMP